jgi:3-dehydroquinate dehydratase I
MRPRIVGVIFSRADLRRAPRMRKPPDLFELRLDALADCIHEVKDAVACLSAPFIITARHPREGGANRLSAPRRRALLLAFLPHAQFVDIELRSAASLLPLLQLQPQPPSTADIRDSRIPTLSLARATRRRRVRLRTIISFHDLERAPSASRLDKITSAACSSGADIVKIAVRTDTAAQLDTLLDFFERHRRRMKLVAMGIGKLGRVARVALARRGCLLNYGHLGSAAAPGQLSVEELRRVLSGR